MTEQSELDLDLRADYGWFHVMKPRLAAGLIAQIGETAWAVYTIIKAHADHYTGRSYPSQDEIGKLVGKTAETVGKATKVLAEHSLIREGKKGRYKEYQLLESAPLIDRKSGLPEGSADFPYVPKEFANQLKALKSFIQEGVAPGNGITLNLTVNLIQQRDHGTVTLQTIQVSPEQVATDAVKEFSRKLRMLNS